ncbi:molybdopterin synthase sulfur carrier subunit [Salisediminibacterium halotolerans]|uniref:Molybdopterin synthase sulfur carrier subunit n=2 Tax=Salisediminibacterium halotolerans TaxID=517425 RepID=A0A1H9PCV4_9BACI|nr:molybdopterin synthase sulfur carrier subunit [Actinophytocola xinjiangensis]RPE88638.1 molybdopterin synthase sulfur carrier subunit [Salisediminibacterium halotolerans]TWG37001.1 molybdopterin synthase sulfur carrier subunit [Salisediminibacterium halotolerans]GEL08789.1 molybdopterin synthase sulfur carrier subunit [Salisediminibacterium halotolerans]SER45403.1 molybdopterin synthase sulfur carrier subunit [Salisediminibacterium haloalkalitolerans]
MKTMKVFANFRDICGGKTVNVAYEENETIGVILEDLIARFPEMEEELFENGRTIRQHVHVFVNGKNVIHLDGLDTVVYPQDELALFPPVAGG